MKYVADLLKKSFPTSSTIREQIQKFLNGEGFDLDNQQLNEHFELSVSSSVMKDDPLPVTSDFTLVKEAADYDFQKTNQDALPSMVFPYRIDENISVPPNISLNEEKLICESPEVAEDSRSSFCSAKSVEDGGKSVLTPTSVSGKMQKVLDEEVFSPDHQMIMENSQLCVFSPVRIDNPVTPDLLFDEENVDIEMQKNYEIHHPCTILQDNIEDSIPAVTAISLREEENISGYQKIVEESHMSLSSTDRVEDGIPDVQEVFNGEIDSGHQKILDDNDFSMKSCARIESIPDTLQILLNEDEPDIGHQMISEENDFSKNSGTTMENERLSVPIVVEQESEETNCHSDPAILEPRTLPAAAAPNVSYFLSFIAVNVT